MPASTHYRSLAKILVDYSTKVQTGDRVLIDATDIPEEFLETLIQEIRNKGGLPFLQLQQGSLTRKLLCDLTQEEANTLLEIDLHRIQKMQVYLGLRGSHNIYELSDIDPLRMKMLSSTLQPALDYRVNKTRWVVLRWPTSAMAQQAGMSTRSFEEFYFNVTTFDYSRMQEGMLALKTLMDNTDRVQIKGPETDLRFSIKGIGSVACAGEFNIPDGEVFSAPIKDSVEGYISYNAPTIYRGISFDSIKLEFSKGAIISASSSNTLALNQILDTDPGARYIGEFALGFHPLILHPMRDILFDEKIAGSFHFTPGKAYEIAGNGNQSAVHWDMVSIQREDYGGGEIYFDDVLIRKDGLFTLDPLKKLNPDFLLKN